jgi:hypothetical protein
MQRRAEALASKRVACHCVAGGGRVLLMGLARLRHGDIERVRGVAQVKADSAHG